MPKSKRNKQVDLSKTRQKGLEGKKNLYQKIQENVDTYAHVFVFSVADMRNAKMKNLREQWKHSRFFIGKNKVMAMALGRSPEEEYKSNLHKVGQMLKGERGLLFTNQSIDECVKWFESFSEGDYARSGNVATEDVTLSEGPLQQFPHNLEAYLRQLGLPTTLKKGVIHLIQDYVVCRSGDRLSPETARILKLLGYEMAEFRVKLECVWSQDGSFVDFQSGMQDSEAKENISELKHSCTSEKISLIDDPVVHEKTQDLKSVENIEECKKLSMDPTSKDDDVTAMIVDDVSEEPKPKKRKGGAAKKTKTMNKKEIQKDNEENYSEKEKSDIFKITEEKLVESAEKPKKFSPRVTRARAAATKKNVTSELVENKTRKRKM
ncbi:mRNA turnover protein 4 homolog [Caerostris darwini]|uniref:Ribosome assembly factor mrt4 n=1 Tax=Caerostris darwini TaxID=1538125 RepID=A0AAV4N7K8_9ARAC|nr:mRNA turnover protein 4 homolog [Caerostris darwini]